MCSRSPPSSPEGEADELALLASGRWQRRVSSAFVGVHRRKQEGRWSAKIKHDGKHHHVGYFDDEQEAAAPFRRVLYTMPDIMPYRRLARQRSDMI